jgi:hypothetical protein
MLLTTATRCNSSDLPRRWGNSDEGRTSGMQADGDAIKFQALWSLACSGRPAGSGAAP